ncbi:MAG: hypothetical protein COX62_07470 [Deltaproteobacteria bacterium CG_4_10_14_0_2_um_filter_43_8]|nr:MAG: hypothetical protein COV43_09455 [Deltaproteobacteria bacterium CG11_big_fil_rev_8_21_14_0_20_42_23]PJA19025.1 MAG: hypothetical protein COX62_07470 [Deltaproteobacteria bacterium CG_4_10_14_0_2_um_filter_43_8]PJC64352.1 MAG: hypothetical protein CO021_04950 [Deltaproteobacteria bacterium CG_4_9_14_0_2_um_filter_42_21]
MVREIPFFPNTGDGTHCWQAVLMMVLSYFEPEQHFSYEELDRISAKQDGKWTWPTASMLWLHKRGYNLKLIEDFDFADFAQRGEAYVIDRCGEEVGKIQIEQSNILQELAFAREFSQLSPNPLEVRLPALEDLKQLKSEGYLSICNVNASLLYQQPGYSAHFVLVCDVGETHVTLHDPGLPPQASVKIKREVFEKAWAFPSEREKNVLALKKG